MWEYVRSHDSEFPQQRRTGAVRETYVYIRVSAREAAGSRCQDSNRSPMCYHVKDEAFKHPCVCACVGGARMHACMYVHACRHRNTWRESSHQHLSKAPAFTIHLLENLTSVLFKAFRGTPFLFLCGFNELFPEVISFLCATHTG